MNDPVPLGKKYIQRKSSKCEENERTGGTAEKLRGCDSSQKEGRKEDSVEGKGREEGWKRVTLRRGTTEVMCIMSSES